MGYLTKFGTMWGDVVETTGRLIWVAPASPYTIDGRAYSSSDNNDGLSPEKALATIQQAITNATSDVGDTIMLLGAANGTNHTSAATVTLNKNGLTFIGVNPQFRQNQNFRNYALTSKVSWTSTFAGVGITNTGTDNAFVGINFIPLTAQSMMTLVGCSRTTFVDSAVTLSAAASTSTKGLVFSGTNADCAFINCRFLNTIATSAQGPAVDLTGAARFSMDSCDFVLTGTSSAWAVACQFGAGSSGIIRNCFATSLNAGTITSTFDGTGVAVAGAVQFYDCRSGVIPGAVAFTKNWTATNATLDNCYLATVGGGTGGTLITSTT